MPTGETESEIKATGLNFQHGGRTNFFFFFEIEAKLLFWLRGFN